MPTKSNTPLDEALAERFGRRTLELIQQDRPCALMARLAVSYAMRVQWQRDLDQAGQPGPWPRVIGRISPQEPYGVASGPTCSSCGAETDWQQTDHICEGVAVRS